MKEIFQTILEFLATPLVQYGDLTISIFSILKVVILILLLQLVLIILKKFLRFQIKSRELHHGDIMAIYQIVKYILVVVVVVMILANLGINTTLLWTSSAALMVGVGMGLQNIFKDVLSGIMILFGKVVRVGDIVEVGDILGRVIEIHLRTSKMVTRDDIDMVVPNSKFVEDNVINWTLDNSHVRLMLKVGVAYGSDIELVRDILLNVAKRNKEVIDKPEPKVRFSDFGDSSLDFQLLFWTNEVFRQEFVKSDLRFEVDKEFRKANITIPFPQRTVWHQRES